MQFMQFFNMPVKLAFVCVKGALCKAHSFMHEAWGLVWIFQQWAMNIMFVGLLCKDCLKYLCKP